MGLTTNDTYQDYAYSDLNDTCPEGYERFWRELSHPVWTHHVCAAIFYIILVFNGLVIYMFKQEKKKSPFTVLFISLAVTDSVAAFSQSMPWHLGLLLQQITEDGYVVRVKAAFCSFFVVFEAPFFYAINDTSILITTQLGIMKLLAVQFPFWFRIHASCKMTICIVTALFLLCFGLEMYPVVTFSFKEDDNGMCCTNLEYSKFMFEYSVIGTWITPILFLMAFVSMIFTTTFIIAKPFCCRQNKQIIKMSESVREKNLQLARSLIIITVVFFLCEFLDLLCVLSPLTALVLGLPDVFEMSWFIKAFKYQKIIQMVGFASNFVIYIVSSEDLRSQLKALFTKKQGGNASVSLTTISSTIGRSSDSFQ